MSRVQAVRRTRTEVLVRQAAKRYRAKLAEERRIFWSKVGAFAGAVVYFAAIFVLMWALLSAGGR